MSNYFSGQGKVLVAPLIGGMLAGAHRWVGNVPEFKLGFDTSKLEHKESHSGQRLTDKVITTELKATVSATLEEWSRDNLAMATRGSVVKSAGGAVTDELSPALLGLGTTWTLAGTNVTALTITDSSSSPATVDPTHYTHDPVYGTVEMTDMATYKLPFKASYTQGAVEVVPFFTQGVQEVNVVFNGVNTAEGNAKVRVEIYRVALDPTKELGLISNDFSQFVLEGNALVDDTKTADPVFGSFGRMLYLG